MLDINKIRNNPKEIKAGIKAKNTDPALVDKFLELDEKWRALTKKSDDARAEQKKLGEAKKVEEAKKLKEELKKMESELAELEKSKELIHIKLPNLPFPEVPIGKDESGNIEIRKWGEIPKFDFRPKDHLELGESLDIIDVKKASEVSGTRFNYLKGAAAQLEFAIVQFVFSTLTNQKIIAKIAKKIGEDFPNKTFVPVIPPVMIKPEIFKRMARLDPGQEEERFFLPKDNLYLIGSAEHTLGPLHIDEILEEKNLPLRYIGFSTAFRREAGSYGKDTKGILRVHQFDKLEIESFTTSEISTKEQDFIISIQEYLMQKLNLPYRVMNICTGDMGGPDARQIDIETWMPGQNKYRETHTSDLMTDYQSRRLNTKVRKTNGKLELVHMNDATAFAIGRIIIAIMENYQTKTGTIKIPKVLQPYLSIDEIK